MRGFTLIDVLVGIALVLIVFLGIFGAFQLGLKAVGLSQNKITAIAIANQKIEMARNLSYESVGTVGASLPFAEGIFDETSAIICNNTEYKIETKIKYIIDTADGVAGPDDSCPNDYKRMEVKVSWSGRFGGEVLLSTDIAPKDLAQECLLTGGVLSISVFDAYGVMVSSPTIEIFDPETGSIIDFATPFEGKHYFPLSASTYKVVVSKTGFSTDSTYGTDEVATPEKPNPIVLEGQLTEISFSIDKLSSFSVDTLSSWGMSYFSDSFLDESKIFDSSNVVISGGKVSLAKTDSQYENSGFLMSTDILPANLILWDEFSFSDLEPVSTQILYQILYFDGENWVLIPDVDLLGNSTGFMGSPINLSSLDPATYSQLRLKANLSTTDTSVSPFLYDWQVSWKNSEPNPIPNVTFHLQGEKLIGKDENEDPVYKYLETHTSDSNGLIDIPNLEWDSYTFSVDPATGLDLVDIDPSPQPIGLFPDTSLVVDLHLEAENSLLVTVQNNETLEPIFSATVRLYNVGLGYDTTQYTNEKGQTYFIPLEAAIYTLEVQALGYLDDSTTISVSGDNTKTMTLEQVE